MSLSLVQVLDLNFSALIYGPCTPCLGQKSKGQKNPTHPGFTLGFHATKYKST